MRQPSVSVIIVHYRGREMLRRCLDSLLDTNYDSFRVVLVDNGSRDGSVEFVKKLNGDLVDVIRSEENLGFVGGNNLALPQVKSKYVALLNDDTVVAPDWLKRLVNVANNDPSIGACQPKLLSLSNPKCFEYNGCAGGMLDVYGVPFCRGRVFDLIEDDNGQYDATADVFWASGAAILVKRQVLDDVGFLDDMFHAHMEEIDLCWRIRLAGYRVVCVPSSVVYHLGGGTPLPEKFYLKERNNLIMMLKNFSGRSLLKFFPLRVVLDSLSTLYFLTNGSPRRSLYTLKGYFGLLGVFRKAYERRLEVQRHRRVPEEKILNAMAPKSVAIQHYLMNRKFFNQLQVTPRSID